MEVDARSLSDDAVLEADICIIGGGPAGLTVATALAGTGRAVLLLESGGTTPDPRFDELNEGDVVGDAYAGLRATRQRGLGGTALSWNTPVVGEPGAKYAPLDAADFARTAGALGGWPFDYTHLEPFLHRAQQVCGLGAFAYDAEAWTTGARVPIVLAGDRVTTRVYQFGAARVFTGRKLAALHSADNVTVCRHATVRALNVERGRARHADVVDADGRPLRVRASTFVLAAGAIENARLLLLSLDETVVGAAHAWIGRCFMEHPRDHALTLSPRSPELFCEAAFYDAHRAVDGTFIGGRLALTDLALTETALPNASATLLPRPRQRSRLGLFRARLGGVAARQQRGGYGWSALEDPGAVFDAFRMIVNIEQRPHPENRIVLTNQRDRLGMPRVALHWQWRPEEQAGVQRLRVLIARAIEDAALGRVDVQSDLPLDPNAHHHAGTTRMSESPQSGVVDADGCVHGVDNLYVAGASVFPTAGFANPTLTIVALALRLADHLAGHSRT